MNRRIQSFLIGWLYIIGLLVFLLAIGAFIGYLLISFPILGLISIGLLVTGYLAWIWTT